MSFTLKKEFIFQLSQWCIELDINPLTYNPEFKLPSITRLLKTPWIMEKMLVISIFSISHNDFYHSEIFSFPLNLSSTNALTLSKSKMLQISKDTV